MAITHTCDRCGREIEREERVRRYMTHRTSFKGSIVGNMFSQSRYDNEREIELCKDCNDSFVDWFNAGKHVGDDEV